MLKQAVRAELLLMGIGSAEEDGGLMDDMISDEDRLQVIQDGAAGNAGAHFFDDHGRLIHTSVTDHLITADFDDLLAIPRRLGVAVGAARARALHAAFVGGLVTMCVLDHETARAVLAL